jgi:alanyl-tRNA synthetase
MTDRLYYRDSYLRQFHARIVDAADQGCRVYLDRTAFYPSSGGQPYDLGTLGGVAVREVVDEDDRIAHVLEAPLAAGEVEGAIDWNRRWDHMQQHTGQHLLSAVLEELFRIKTLSFHLGAEASTIDVDAPSIAPDQIDRAEERCAEIVGEARPIGITIEDAADVQGLRKPSERGGALRIVSIQGMDRSACGGTHVHSTAAIGPVLIRKLDKIRGTVRLEFVCGLRALRRARDEYRWLVAIGRTLASPLEETPALVASQIEKSKALEKTCNRLATELARREGSELYRATAPDAAGIRRHLEYGAIDDAMRARAQAFAAGEKALFLAVCDQPPAVLLAVAPDTGIHAGERMKAAVASAGGRGGGNQTLAQGSAASAESLQDILKLLG